MNKKRKKIMLTAILLSITILSYIAVWFSMSLSMSEAIPTNQESKKIEDCVALSIQIAKNFNVPVTKVNPNKKAIGCSRDMSFLLKEYRKLEVYGITDIDQQRSISHFIEESKESGKPIKLIIYEEENWIADFPNTHHRGPEKKVYESWHN